MTAAEEYDLIQLAFNIAENAHKGQFRRDGVTPYIEHVRNVWRITKERGGSVYAQAAALGHDLFEDTEETPQSLDKQGIPFVVIEAIDALSHREGETYMQSIARAKANPIARQVKIADNLANLSDDPTDKQILKYAKSLQTLMQD